MKNIYWIFLFLTSTANATHTDACGDAENIRLEMNIIASNIANLNTTRTPDGGPYQRKYLICESQWCEVMTSSSYLTKFEPDHPDSDSYGFVRYPDINLMEEMSAMIAATREYESLKKDCK